MSELRPLPYGWREVRERLQADMPHLLSRLFPGARVPGRGLFTPLNPTRHDRRPGSFVVHVDGERAGGWVEYATGEKGDVFQLIGYVLRLPAPIDTYSWALEFLGLDRGRVRAAPDDVQARERAARDAAAARARDEALGEARSGALFKLWLSLPSIAGTPAERYLREARGVDLSRLPHLPNALRWAEAVEYADPETGELHTWRHCMVAAMTRGKRVSALHRTYLRADGLGKAAVPKPKLMIGPARHAAIRLTRGAVDLSPAKAEARGLSGPLAVGEGIETVLTVAAARPDFRCWAAGSVSLMGLLDWPACASAVVLLGENDDHPEARAAFGRVEAHWRAQARGRPLEVVRPPAGAGKDFNDWGRSTDAAA